MKHLPLLLVLPFLLPVAAIAQGPGGGAPPPRVFVVALETDGDGQLSAAEIAAASASLAKLDKNHDGRITSEEYSQKLKDETAGTELLSRLMVMDRNGDGVLTVDEISERMKPMFERGDTNHDGKLTGEEIRAMAAAQADPQGRPVGRGNFNSQDPVILALDVDKDGVISAEEIANAPVVLKVLDKDGDGTVSVAELRVRPQTAEQRAAHLFDEWDTNQDKVLVKSEMPDRMQAQFETLDLNHDGKLDLAEATVYFASMPAQGPGGGRPGGPGGGGPGGPGGGRGPRPEGAPAGPPQQ
jgi:Ca2+-binding EF-hand superfamily protein